MAGGVTEVMLHLRDAGLLNTDALTVTGEKLGSLLDWWEASDRRGAAKEKLILEAEVEPDRVIMSPDKARREGLTSTVVFPTGNLAPEGSVVKATAIDPAMVGEDGVYRHRGPARLFTSEREAIRAVKGLTEDPVRPGDVLILAGVGPMGTGMEETAQVTMALKYLPWGKTVPVLTDARFSGVSTGPCIGHIGPEALAGGPLGKVRDGETIEILIDRKNLIGSINLVIDGETPEDTQALLEERQPHPDLRPDPSLPDDTRLWAAMQRASGGVWRGCIYDVERIVDILDRGLQSD
jgi:dihydroxyacid dehydratase/phosphogluconate dehydratase